MSDTPPEPEAPQPYQVLARKYRPSDFESLIGQEAMVRTLRNAFEADRIAHAFVMTGVRGVGKTTTARIIAKGLNCVGEDGQGGPTIHPCGECDPCREIAEGRFIDVLEIDAASNTGVDFIREINQIAGGKPVAGRFKVFILDEVHMLSNNAFNALLKTLEEPPGHVKFIFATTEIRKVPVTVLSRCQRFDLRRVEPEALIDFLSGIAGKEGVEIAGDALALIARAAEGSVRDALSLLDQAISHGAGAASVEQVRSMLGLADRGRVLDLFELVMKGDAAGALTELGAQYSDGADPLSVLRDLAEVTHWVSVVKISPETADDPTVSPDERERGKGLAESLSMRVLTRMWQMLLKALAEVASSPNAMMAAEMAVIRLTHVAELPSPEELVRRLTDAPGAGPSGGGGGSGGGSGGVSGLGGGGVRAQAGGGVVSQPAPAQAPQASLDAYAKFDDVVALIRAKRDAKLLVDIERGLRLVAYEPGQIEFQPTEDAPPSLAHDLKRRLENWTGHRWAVLIAGGGGGATLAEARKAEADDLEAQARGHPLVQAALEAFPGAEIQTVTPLVEEAVEPPPEEALDMDEFMDPDDPFGEEP